MSYNMAIDMWSLGCILAELYTGYPLFPGENEQEQLMCIMEINGPPERYLVEKSSRKKIFFGNYRRNIFYSGHVKERILNNVFYSFLTLDHNGNPKQVVNSKGKKRKPNSKTLGQVLKCSDVLFLDFISKCLIWDPEKRMKPFEGLQHEWISDVKAPARTLLSPTLAVADTGSSSRRKSSLYEIFFCSVRVVLKFSTIFILTLFSCVLTIVGLLASRLLTLLDRSRSRTRQRTRTSCLRARVAGRQPTIVVPMDPLLRTTQEPPE